jgi:hypothetical protein
MSTGSRHAGDRERGQGYAPVEDLHEAGTQTMAAALGISRPAPGGRNQAVSSWLETVLQEGMPQQHSSLTKSSAAADADSIGTVSSLADSLASTASTVSSVSFARQSGLLDTGAGSSRADFSWESSYGRSTFPGSWPSPGTTHAPGAGGHDDAVRAHELQHALYASAPEGEAERRSRVGPMLSAAASRQGLWAPATTSSAQGRRQRYEPYARPGPDHAVNHAMLRLPHPMAFAVSNFDELKSFHHADYQTPNVGAPTIPVRRGPPEHHQASTTVLDDADLTLGPGNPTRYSGDPSSTGARRRP